MKIGDNIELSGGYDYDPLYLKRPPASKRSGTIIQFIKGQNEQPAAVIKLTEKISGEVVTGDIAVLELRWEGYTWDNPSGVHIELCDFIPENKAWKDRKQGEWIEGAATIRLADTNKKSNLQFNIRNATPDDVPALASLHVQTFNETHGTSPNNPSYDTRFLQWEKIFKEQDGNWFCLVIEIENKSLIGFAKGQPYSDPDQSAFAGELNKIYLLKQYHRLGLGKQLLERVVDEFKRRGIKSMLLFGDANNPSNGFYERMGGEKLFAKNGEFHGGYGWKDLDKLLEDQH